MGPYPPQTVLIIGGGEFGLACAEELANTTYKGHANLITVVDRSATPPSVDAASSDLNKVNTIPLPATLSRCGAAIGGCVFFPNFDLAVAASRIARATRKSS